MQITVRSMLRRAAWMKWLPPMPKRSPSPEMTTTFILGLASFSPVAKGMARPWCVEGVEPHVAGDPAAAADPETTRSGRGRALLAHAVREGRDDRCRGRSPGTRCAACDPCAGDPPSGDARRVPAGWSSNRLLDGRQDGVGIVHPAAQVGHADDPAAPGGGTLHLADHLAGVDLGDDEGLHPPASSAISRSGKGQTVISRSCPTRIPARVASWTAFTATREVNAVGDDHDLGVLQVPLSRCG